MPSSTTGESAPALDAHGELMTVLSTKGVEFRTIDHPPEGRTDLVSQLRGNRLQAAAKCVIVMAKLDKKTKRYLLGVVPGDRRVDLTAVKELTGASYVGFASLDIAERLAGSPSGTILPFSFHPDLELVVDPDVLETPEIFFNAARLDRSVALRTSDYAALAQPRIAPIADRKPQGSNA